MNYDDMISDIEDEPVILHDDFYYHAFPYKREDFINMINEGIKSPILLKKKAGGYNGYFYVCLSKKERCEMSVYNLLNSLPMFIINGNIRVIKTRNFKRCGSAPMWLNSPFPFRKSEYDDEYQKFLKISSKDIFAIQYNLFSNCHQYNEIEKDLFILKSMIEDLNCQGIHLPIIDVSASKKINQEKVLSLK